MNAITIVPKSDRGRVLSLINRGRAALGMESLASIPAGRDDPDLSPLARAFNVEVWAPLGNHPCYCEHVTAHLPDRRRAKRLADAYQVCPKACGPSGPMPGRWWSVVLPEELARFTHEFQAGEYPDLIDRGVLTIDESSKRFGCSQAEIESYLEDGLIPGMKTVCEEWFLVLAMTDELVGRVMGCFDDRQEMQLEGDGGRRADLKRAATKRKRP